MFCLLACTNRCLKGRLINQVLETRFSGGRHVKKRHIKHDQTMETEFKTQFIGLNRVFENQDVSNIYSLKIVPTNHII